MGIDEIAIRFIPPLPRPDSQDGSNPDVGSPHLRVSIFRADANAFVEICQMVRYGFLVKPDWPMDIWAEQC